LATRSSSKGIVVLLAIASAKTTCGTSLSRDLLAESSLGRSCACELLLEERVVSSLCCPEPVHAASSRVDEGTRSSVLRWDTKIAHVSERILSFAGGEECIESSVLWVDGFLLLLRLWRGLEIGYWVWLTWLTELVRGLLLVQGIKGRSIAFRGLLLLLLSKALSERVVRSRWHWLQRIILLLRVGCPRIVAASLWK